MITVIIKNPAGEEIGSFEANDKQAITELASQHGIDIPISCGGGVCGVCMCDVQEGANLIKPDLITAPIQTLPENQILACIAGIKSEAFADGEDHTIILQRKY